MLTDGLRSASRFWPGPVPADDELDQALAFLGASVDTATVYRACYVAASVLVFSAFGLVMLVPRGEILAIPVLALATTVAFTGPSLPKLLARAKRTRALGSAPPLVARATLSMELAPSPERAATFAAEAGDGVLAESLAAHVRRTAAGPGTGLQSFATEWDPWFPELRRACSLVESAGSVSPGHRSATLARARDVVLDAARDRMADFAASIRGPATAIYAFGVLLPLALASMLPALRGAGVPTPIVLFVVAYDLVLPAGVLGASAWLLARRPVAFPPPSIGRTHPDVPTSQLPGICAGVAVGAFAWMSASAILPSWTAPLAAVGAGSGAALVVHYRPARQVHESVTAVEDGLSDALALLGRRIEREQSVESAVPAVADEITGPTSSVLATAARRQRLLGVGVEEAFLGVNGALDGIPSDRVRSAAKLLALAASEGRPTGEAVREMGDHVQELAAVEAAATRSVERVTSTLSNTAAIFGPLVGGATVALSGAVGAAGPLGGDGSTATIGLAVGGYVLLLAAILTALSTGLSRGFDRTLVGYRAGFALLSATATYLTSFVGTGLVV